MKYELTAESKTMPNGDVVFRIKALKSFTAGNGQDVRVGDLGGWVGSEKTLSHSGKCWLFDEAVNSGNSLRSRNAVGSDNAWSYGNSQQYGDSWQYDDSWQYGNSRQYGDSRQFGYSMQFGDLSLIHI